MTDRRTSDVLGGLPNSRPHRRSDKRGARAPENGSNDHTDAPVAPAPKRASGTRAKPPARAQSAARSKTPKATGGPKAVGGPKAASNSSASPRKPAGRSRISQPAQPAGTPRTPRASKPEPPDQQDILGTAIQAAAELAEIGLTVGARALRSAMSRLPRP